MRVFRTVLVAALALAAAAAHAQTYPSRAVRMLVGYPAGGGMDGVARILADKLAADLGQPVVVENRAGASGSIAAGAAATAAPDGHTLYLGETGYLILSTLSPNLPADPVRSFVPVAPVGVLPLVFTVSPGFPAKSVAELIAVLKANPGRHSYGSPGVGTVHHLAFEQFKRAAGVDVVHVPYKGGGPIVPDVMSGRLEIGVLSTTLAAGPAKADKLRVIAVTSAQRVGFAPDWPPLGETIAGFDAAPSIFLLAPAGTPAPVVARLNDTTRKALGLPDLQQAFSNQGASATPGSPDALRAQIDGELKRWGAAAKAAGVTAN
jgi:tripartite-type tricarboxylate transporter receptor subunit TctC